MTAGLLLILDSTMGLIPQTDYLAPGSMVQKNGMAVSPISPSKHGVSKHLFQKQLMSLHLPSSQNLYQGMIGASYPPLLQENVYGLLFNSHNK